MNPRGRTLSEKARAFIGRHVRHHIEDLGMAPKTAVAVAYQEAREKGFLVPRRRKNSLPVPTIADELEAVTYRGGTRKKGAYIHEYETGAELIPVVGGEVELPDGTILEVDPGSVLQRSKEGLPLWMEE